ncbi:hypothetical protein ASPCAL07420 [Aspergillus calidoustus]|uniref:ABM domain-containing protein n=1 Tax=Aspergillus calidoustus TaxID=454130 RepID=A0A0U5CAN6_ASPCI|nr:hypothetical protein ASPCAL07420 [Aspergillus calidoustus]
MSIPAQTGFNIQATLFLAPEDTPRVLEALKPVYEQTIAEPECLSFQVYQLRDDPGQILLVEDWETPLERYMVERLKVDYMQEFFAIIQPLFTRPQEVKVFDRLGQFHHIEL